MPRRYFKRYRMEYDLLRQEPPAPQLPDGFAWRSWADSSVQQHAMAKFRAFAGSIDADVFPSLRTYDGCLRLMRFIDGRCDFVPHATWLIVSTTSERFGDVPVGTIQVCSPVHQQAAVQNIGVVPEFRGCGLGRALLLRSLLSMRAEGFHRGTLDVTARNATAADFYARVGFVTKRTSYRRVMLAKEAMA